MTGLQLTGHWISAPLFYAMLAALVGWLLVGVYKLARLLERLLGRRRRI